MHHHLFNKTDRISILFISTIGFSLMFAVWLMFGVLAIPIEKEFNLSIPQFGWLTTLSIFNGSLFRFVSGIFADRFGSKRIFLILLLYVALFSFFLSYAHSLSLIYLLSFFLGFAGTSWSIGVSWLSICFPKDKQGFVIGFYAAGIVGASFTNFIGPSLISLTTETGYFHGLIPGGWRFIPFIYFILLVVLFVVTLFFTPALNIKPTAGKPWKEIFTILHDLRVWRFGLYYFVFFGTYVALSVWLTKYYVDVFNIQLKYAALLTATFIFPGALLRPVGGWLSDLYGPKKVLYFSFIVMIIFLAFVAVPHTMNPLPFAHYPILTVIFIFNIGICIGLGGSATYKYILECFPQAVGGVGGLVGCLGSLGGFFFPILFTYFLHLTGDRQSCFFILLVITFVTLLWFHFGEKNTLLGITNKQKNLLKNIG